MSPLPKMMPLAPKAPMKEPPGFDRVKAIKIVQEGPAAAPVFKVYSVNGTLLGAASTQGKANTMRDTFPLDKLFL